MVLSNIADWCARLRQALRGRAARERAEVLRLLEETIERERGEVARLREENRALLNSVLGTAGVPPIETAPMHPAGAAAVRRRSWPQIATTREIEAAREMRARERALRLGAEAGERRD